MKPFLVLLAGLALGLAAAAGDLLTGLHTSDAARVIFWIPNLGSVWVAGAFFAGAWFRRRGTGALSGLGLLLAAVVAYYAFGVTVGDRSHLGLAAIWPTVRVWLVAAVVFGPLFGLAGFLYRRGGPTASLVAALALPAALVLEASLYLLESLPYLGNDPWREILLVLVLLVGLWLAAALLRRRRARLRVCGDDACGEEAGIES